MSLKEPSSLLLSSRLEEQRFGQGNTWEPHISSPPTVIALQFSIPHKGFGFSAHTGLGCRTYGVVQPRSMGFWALAGSVQQRSQPGRQTSNCLMAHVAGFPGFAVDRCSPKS